MSHLACRTSTGDTGFGFFLTTTPPNVKHHKGHGRDPRQDSWRCGTHTVERHGSDSNVKKRVPLLQQVAGKKETFEEDEQTSERVQRQQCTMTTFDA